MPINTWKIKEADPEKKLSAQMKIEKLGKLRGRALIYPCLPSGKAQGPFVEMQDGSVKLDLICGIGVSLFGYNHPDILKTSIEAAAKFPAMQGTLMPCDEQLKVSELLIESANKVSYLGPEAQGNFSGTWITTCGTMANELALKVLRQKKAPAYKVISFQHCFSGRSSTMQELTDEPKYREGQPTFDQFKHLPYFDSKKSLSENIQIFCSGVDGLMAAEPGKFAGFVGEPIPAEGFGFAIAPREWWVAILTHMKNKGLAIWFDEIQTFSRTGEMYAFQRLGLAQYVDVLTVAKPLFAAAVLWSDAFKPKPGLIAGTFSGTTVALAVGAKTMELLMQGNYFGPQGKIQNMERFFIKDLAARRERLGPKLMREANIIGGMVGIHILDGKAETIKKFLDKLYENGVIGFSAGKDPVLLRFLPPMGIMNEEYWNLAMDIVEKTLKEFAT